MAKVLKTLILLLLLTFIYSQTCSFEQYITQFNRTYTGEQKDAREAIFAKRIKQIEQFNSGEAGYTIGYTRWTDRFDNQLPGRLELMQSPEANSLTSENEQISVSDTLKDEIVVSETGSLDWRLAGGVSSVKAQGSCGSCWSFATVAAIQSLLLIKSSESYDLSEQYLLQCSGINSCKGGSYRRAYNQVIKQQGLPLQIQYPYRASDDEKGICGKGNFKTINNLLVQQSRNLTNVQMIGLINELPPSVVIIADSRFLQYRSGIFRCNYTTDDSMVNHAVQIVGYNTTGNYYIIKNEWGTSWGMNGFAYVDMTQDCMLKREVWKVDGSGGAMTTRPSNSGNNQSLAKYGIMLFILIVTGLIA